MVCCKKITTESYMAICVKTTKQKPTMILLLLLRLKEVLQTPDTIYSAIPSVKMKHAQGVALRCKGLHQDGG